MDSDRLGKGKNSHFVSRGRLSDQTTLFSDEMPRSWRSDAMMILYDLSLFTC